MSDKKSRAVFVARSIGGLCLVLAVASGLWSFFRWLALRLTVGHPGLADSYGIGVGVFIATLVACALLMSVVGRLVTMGGRHDHLADLSAALRRIARGDFDVAVPVRDDARRFPFGQIVGDFNDMARSLKRMEDLRQEFISTVSHDIQTPLTSISGFARVLRDESLEPGTRAHCLDVIEEESSRLSRLADELLHLSVLEDRAPQPVAEPYRLDEQIRQVVLAAEPLWSRKAVDLDLELDDVRIRADADMLGQVWANLLHNAIKFSRPGGRITIRLWASGDRARFRISDEGMGIDSEDLPRVFDRFFKADASRTADGPLVGNGLGLAIVKKAVELHGGGVNAESAGPGKGSSFEVDLPLVPAESCPPAYR
jgi:signal transduction histidine kinase